MFIYDRAKAQLELFSPLRVNKMAGKTDVERVSLRLICDSQIKWIGREVLEGHTPSVDFAYDQMIMEMKLAQNYEKEPEAFPKSVNWLFERFKKGLNPTLDDQRLRLTRMYEFFGKVMAADTSTGYVLTDPDYRVLKGRAVLARAIMDGEETINVIRLAEMPYPLKIISLNVWDDFKVLDNVPFD